MARMSPQARREAILAATMRVMERKGIAGTTVRDVAAELGVSSGLIHHYVSSMDDLLAEAFEVLAGADLTRLRADLATAADDRERLAAFFTGYTRGEDDASFQLWLDAWAEAARRPALRRVSTELNVAWQRLLAETIASGVAAGTMACDDPDATAWRVVSLLDGLSLQVVAHAQALRREVVLDWAMAYAETEVGLPAGALRRGSSHPYGTPRRPAAKASGTPSGAADAALPCVAD